MSPSDGTVTSSASPLRIITSESRLTRFSLSKQNIGSARAFRPKKRPKNITHSRMFVVVPLRNPPPCNLGGGITRVDKSPFYKNISPLCWFTVHLDFPRRKKKGGAICICFPPTESRGARPITVVAPPLRADPLAVTFRILPPMSGASW